MGIALSSLVLHLYLPVRVFPVDRHSGTFWCFAERREYDMTLHFYLIFLNFLFRLISYPRTETNIFPANLPLAPLVEQQAQSPEWGTFAQRVLDQPGGPNPRQGKNSDQAHPPIHPTKYTNTLQVGWFMSFLFSFFTSSF